MLARVFAIAMNTYREAVRARVLHGLLAAALATTAYSLVLAALSLHQEVRVIADIGASSMSFYAVLVAIILGATSLHRELELKTVFPILTRKLRRHEYLVGKYLGTLATVGVFVAIDGATVFAVLGLAAGARWTVVAGAGAFFLLALVVLLVRAKYTRVFVLLPWSVAAFATMFALSSAAGMDRQMVFASCALTIFEVIIVAAIAMLFSSFSSPFLTAIFTMGVFLVGRSADTLANLPERVFGPEVHRAGEILARIFPNLHAYAPPRALLLGRVVDVPVTKYLAEAGAHAVFYAAVLLAISALVFRRRDFQ